MSNQIFNYPDTNSSRSNLSYLNRKFEELKIAIIGLGGTGSYILDLVAKTPVAEIHLFDGDKFQIHNAFRAPGATPGATFDIATGTQKVNYFKDVYSNLRNGIFAHDVFISEENIESLSIYNFIFISVDRNKIRKMISQKLVEKKIPFIDVGLGVDKLDDCLIGTIRVTAGTTEKFGHLDYRIGEDDLGENDYSTNIQIADLNSLNASLAVIKWKKLVGFYQDVKNEQNILYTLNTNKIFNEDFTT